MDDSLSGRRESRGGHAAPPFCVAAGHQHAPVAGKPQRDGQLAAGFRRKIDDFLDLEAAIGEPAGNLLVAEAEAAMLMLVAQEFELVRREVGDQQPPAGGKRARRLADRGSRIVEKVQHLVQRHEVEMVGWRRQQVDIALAHLYA